MAGYFTVAFKRFLNFRRRRKSLTLVLGGAFFLILFIISLFSTLVSNVESYWGKMLLGDGAIVVRGYKNYRVLRPPRTEDYFPYSKVRNDLRRISGVNFSPRLRVFGMLEGYRSRAQISAVLIGMEANRERAILTDIKLSEGHFPANGTKKIALFFDSAGRLDVGVGDTVIVFTRNIQGYTVYDLMTVSGIIEPRNTQYFAAGEDLGFVPLSFADSIKSVDPGKVSEVVFSSNGFLRKLMLPLLVPSRFKVVNMWNSEDIPLTMGWIYGFVFCVLLALIIGIVFISIFHNIHMMILERRREIGVYLTFGASNWWILRMWFGEFTVYLLYCSILGAAASTAVILGINSLQLTADSANMEVMLASSQFSISLLPEYYLFSFLILWLVVVSASLYPILKDVRENVIVDLFRR